jgi:formate dehydrogenase maturation protein FdhE
MSDEQSEKCPACGSTHMYGVEVQHIYDGVLYWECGRCMWRWHRWPVGSHLRRLAIPFVDGPARG